MEQGVTMSDGILFQSDIERGETDDMQKSHSILQKISSHFTQQLTITKRNRGQAIPNLMDPFNIF